MRIRVIILIFCLFSISSNVLSAWELSSDDGTYSITNKGYEKSVVELDSPSIPKIVEVMKRSSLEIVIVNHGEVGTSCLVKIHKAYVFNSKKKFVGIYPYRVIAVENDVKNCTVAPVNWEFYKNKILIHDLNDNKKFKIISN
jgi:hypothetical protein